MKKVLLKLAVLATVLCIGGFLGTAFAARGHGGNKGPTPPIASQPPTVEEVDASAMTVTIHSGKSSSEKYQLTKFTAIVIDGKPGTIEGIQKGMKASVTGSTRGVSKLELTSGGGSQPQPQQPAQKKNKKNN